MKIRVLHIVVLLFAFVSTDVFAQRPKRNNRKNYKFYETKTSSVSRGTDWKRSRFELTAGAGVTGFLGDLGGQDGIGRPFVFDYNPITTRPSVSLGTRFFVMPDHAIRTTFSYGVAKGSDSLTNNPNRRYRNITVRTPIYELAAIYEWHILKPDFIHMAGARTTRVFTGNRLGAYGYAGVAGMYFNPQGLLNGEWHDLAPLNTEGQGLEGGPDDYRRIGLSVPMGFGVYYLLNYNFKIGFDVGYRWTLTDYMDDASGRYFNNDVIEEEFGKLAAFFANPSVALDDVPNPEWYTETQPRGGSQSNDTYIFAQVTLSKTLGPSITNKPFKQKKTKVRTYKNKRLTLGQLMQRRQRLSQKSKMYNGKKSKYGKRKFKQPKTFSNKKRSRKVRGRLSF